MKKLFLMAVIFLAVSCGSDGSSDAAGDSTINIPPGNSGGSAIIEADTARMDTSFNNLDIDSAR